MPTVLSVGECITSSGPRSVRIRPCRSAAPYVLDEVPPQGERLPADQPRRLSLLEDALDQGVVVVLDVRRLVRAHRR